MQKKLIILIGVLVTVTTLCVYAALVTIRYAYHRDSCQVLANEIAYPLEFLQRDSALYLAGLNSLIDFVGKQDEGFSSIMLVGHNPGLTEFANFLCPGLTNNLPTCGVVSVSLDAETWDLRGDANISLAHHNYPKKQL